MKLVVLNDTGRSKEYIMGDVFHARIDKLNQENLLSHLTNQMVTSDGNYI